MHHDYAGFAVWNVVSEQWERPEREGEGETVQDVFKFACIGKFLWSYRFVHIVLIAWPLDKPAILDLLNFILNLNQARGPYQLSWTLTFRAHLNFVPQLANPNWVPQLGPFEEFNP